MTAGSGVGCREGRSARRPTTRIWVSVIMLLMLLPTQEARTQPAPEKKLPPIDPSGRSGDAPRTTPEHPPAVSPPAPQAGRPAPIIRVFVREIRFSGNTVFTDQDLAPIVAPYLNRQLATEDLEAIRLAVTLHYVRNGYVTSGAIIPDQKVEEGVITVDIIEGELVQINIEGNKYFRPYYLRDRIALGAGPPLNIVSLQERLQFLQQDRRLARINAELRPGVVRGESELNVKVQEARPYHLSIMYNNYQTTTVGANRGLTTIDHDNLTGHGDRFSFTYGRSAGLDLLVDTIYTLPLTPYDTTLTATYNRSDFDVIEDPFDPLDIETETERIGFTLGQPLYRTLNQVLSLSVTGEYLYNKVTIFDGLAFPLAGFTDSGVANVSALRITPEWTYRDQTSVAAVRSRFSVGLDVLDATNNKRNKKDPNGEFFAWLGQAQAVKRLDEWWGSLILGRFDMQLANDTLFPLEQYPVGGRFTVRGYRENTFVRDNAIVASLEARLPLVRTVQNEHIVQLAPFLDYGSGWNSKAVPNALDRGFLASIGMGLRVNYPPPTNWFRFEIYWGQQLNHLDQGDADFDDLQDNGVHMQAVVQLY